MKGLFSRLAFMGFGPHGLSPQAPAPPLFAVQGRRPGRLRALVRREAPRLPGVYGMVDGGGELIYVGKAKCLRARLLSYFRPRSRDPKAGQIVKDARTVVWEPGPSEFAALLRELELIRRWQPRRNVQGQPNRRRRGYVCVGRRPAPYVFLAGKPPATAFARFGPVPAGLKAREAVRRVNDWFRLRDCPQAVEMVFADEQELFPLARAPGCLRHGIGNCLGPCAAACTRADYAGYFRAAVAFLEGKDDSPLGMLEREMLAASAATQFERAAALRDRLDSLRWLSEHLDRLRQAARHSFVYPVSAEGGAETWYLIHRGHVRGAVPAPQDRAGRKLAGAALRAVYNKPGDGPGPPGLDEIDGVLLVAGWFRRHPEERQRTLAPEEALAACGG
ncbi:MAG TPA: UvrB/UvrC motif-containing protein [Gemmataceae bacterium]|nr:UvrB/UvrC motif-containing protein [Gemmataceae bacterium]